VCVKQSFIDSLQHRVLSIAVGVRRGSSSLALQVDAGEEPLPSVPGCSSVRGKFNLGLRTLNWVKLRFNFKFEG
jgi:hypothetical protein